MKKNETFEEIKDKIEMALNDESAAEASSMKNVVIFLQEHGKSAEEILEILMKRFDHIISRSPEAAGLMTAHLNKEIKKLHDFDL